MNNRIAALGWLTAGCPILLISLLLSSSPAEQVPDPTCLPKDPPPPVVKLKMRVPACTEPGRAIAYRMCIENCSESEAHHVVVKDVVPVNAKFLKADPAPSVQGSELQWHLGTIGGGARREITLWLVPTNREDVKNCARVQFEHGLCVVTRQAGHGGGPGSTRGVPSDPTRPVPPIVEPVPEMPPPDGPPVIDVSIRGPKEAYANLEQQYEITLSNRGGSTAQHALLSCMAPAKLKIVRASDQAVLDESSAVWKLGDLASGASKTVQITLKATAQGDHCINVTALATPDLKKQAEFCTKFVAVSALSVEMRDRADPVFLNEKTSFPIMVKSLGSAPITGVRVKAFVPTGLKLVRSEPPFVSRVPDKDGEWLEFVTFPKVDAGEAARYEVFVEAAREGRTRFHIEVRADQLISNLPVIWEELTTIVDDRK